MKIRSYLVLGLLLGAAFSCISGKEEKKLEELPYFNLSGFLDLELAKLDSVQVSKISRVNGEEKLMEKRYSLQEWKEEFQSFYDADINSSALALSYSTETKGEYLIHNLLPEAKGKVKEIRIKYLKEYPSSISFKMSDENLFFSSFTSGEFHLNQTTNKIEQYSVETTQKVWFLKPTNIKISGAVVWH